MLIAAQLERAFILDDGTTEITLPDPEPGWTVAKVRDFYSNIHPILTTATIAGGDYVNDKCCYRFVTTIGTKS